MLSKFRIYRRNILNIYGVEKIYLQGYLLSAEVCLSGEVAATFRLVYYVVKIVLI